MNTSIQKMSRDTSSDLGPFGRSFLGDFPSKGALSLIVLGLLLSLVLSGGFLSFLVLFSVLKVLSIYLSYNYIEPHFNAKAGIVRGDNLSSVTSNGHLAISDIGNMLYGYGKSAANQVRSMPGEINLGSLFGSRSPSDSPDMSEWVSEPRIRMWRRVLLLWIGIMMSGYLISFLMIGLIVAFDIDSLDLFSQISITISYVIMGGIILALVDYEDKIEYLRSLFAFPNISRLKFGGLVALILILDLILVEGYSIIYDSIGSLPEGGELFFDANSANSPLILILIFISLAISAPLIEELIFRGYILDSLRTNYSDLFSIFTSGILFGFMHWDPLFGFFDIYQTGAATIGGFLYGWLRIKTGSLWPSIICHSIWNGTIFLIVYI